MNFKIDKNKKIKADADTKTKKNISGFTLIELIVVIGIISLLTSIAMVSLGQSREKARVAKVQSEFNSLGQAIEMYRQDNKSMPLSNLGGGYSISVPTLVSTYLSSYISSAPVIPSSLSTFDGVLYAINPINGVNFSCGDPSGQEGYLIFFIPNSYASQFDQVFKKIYVRGESESTDFNIYRCISVTQK
jgi:prepilin-type N-terminal cleavage/methylation domain-containing protein